MKLPFRRKPRVRVDVDPVQVAALHHLRRFGPTTIGALHDAVNIVRPLDREMLNGAIATLVAQDVADYRFNPEDGQTRIVLTALGERVARRLPATSKSALAIYV